MHDTSCVITGDDIAGVRAPAIVIADRWGEVAFVALKWNPQQTCRTLTPTSSGFGMCRADARSARGKRDSDAGSALVGGADQEVGQEAIKRFDLMKQLKAIEATLPR